MKKITILLLFTILFTSFLTKAQNVTITPSGITPALSGTYPRLTYDAIIALPSPQEGDIAYDISYSCLRVYNGDNWACTVGSNDLTPSIAAIVSAGGTSNEQANGIAIDASGNVIIVGYFSGTANFGGISKTSTSFYDIFIAKYNNAGSLLWVQTAGGTKSNFGSGIALDASGNVYVTGGFEGVTTFGTTSLFSAGDSDIFVAKYNNSGTFQWVQRAGGYGRDVANSIAVDASGDVYITGEFSQTAYFGGTPKPSVGGSDIFITKYNNSGVLQWVQNAGGTGTDNSNSIAIDPDGKVLISGYFNGTFTFGTTPISSQGFDIFVAKYNPVNSTWMWVRTAGGTLSDMAESIAVDASGNVFVTGYFNGTANFGGITKTSVGYQDIFVAKLYKNSGNFNWVQTVGGDGSKSGNGITVDASGNLFITGSFQSTAEFDETSKTSAGSNDIFVSKYNNSGVFQWVQTAGGVSSDIGYSIAVDANEKIFATGRYSKTAKFGTKSKTVAGDTDIFVIKIQE